MKTRYLVTGSNGQLARAFIRKLSGSSADYLPLNRAELDITDPAAVTEICDSYRPNVIINCAAYNDVDGAEDDPGGAERVNTSGPGLLAQASKRLKALLVHFGSDYVFDGTKEDGLYKEDDPANPINRYGKSKLGGEEAIRKETDDFLIFRLSWVFGDGKQNFIHKLLEWAKNNDYLKIVCDEFSVPTYTGTVADITIKALDERLTGLYHLTNTGFCSRYEWASLIFKRMDIPKFIRPVTVASFDLRAKRPAFSPMDNGLISKELGLEIPAWEQAVESCLEEFHNG